jgi:protein-S-isoprenylcysteine O-methyltransferase Ste14
MGLHARAFGGLVFLLVVLGVALFGTAGTFAYWQAWAFLAVFGVSISAITVDLARRDPALLARRVQAGPLAEPTTLQKVIQSSASLAFLGVFVVSALDRRYGWSGLGLVPVAAGDVLVAAGLFVVFRVFRANTFTSATIEVAREQKLVSSGPYALVRHPMYAGALLMMAGVPIALGSIFGLFGVLVLAAFIVWRLLDEEKQLSENLAGYTAYREQVRYRLVPHVW